MGFSTYLRLTAEQAKKLKAGEIVKALSLSKIEKLPRATKVDLYTYQAFVERVVDADTIWMRIVLGLGIEIRQKLRLRGIDCPELGTKAGEQAKRFVEDKLKSTPEIVITTTKPDKYDRYLTDVWLDDINLNKLLLETGHARLKTAVSPSDWGE